MTAETRTPLRGTDLDRFLANLELMKGAHEPDGQMCVMEAAAFIAGEPWSDRPQCVSPVIGSFLRAWNDGLNDADRQLLKPYVIKCLNTRASDDTEQRRAWMALDWYCRVGAPAWLRAAGLTAAADAVAATAPITDTRSARAAQSALADAADAAAAADAVVASAVAAVAVYAADVAVAAAAAAVAVAAVAVYADAVAALRPTMEQVQRSALELLDRMIALSVPA